MTGRGLRGRETARLMLVAAFAVDAFVSLLMIAAPGSCMCPMYSEPPPVMLGLSLGTLILAIGIALHLGGLAWMLRIYRADPEGHRDWWRFLRG